MTVSSRASFSLVHTYADQLTQSPRFKFYKVRATREVPRLLSMKDLMTDVFGEVCDLGILWFYGYLKCRMFGDAFITRRF